MTTAPEPEVVARRRAAAVAGHHGDSGAARALLADGDAGVRAAALGALARSAALLAADLEAAVADPAPGVRRRAAELVGAGAGSVPIIRLLDDGDSGVAEVAAWALGELDPPEPGSVARLAAVATEHPDALVREAAVAALGSIGDDAGLPAVLHATTDKATVRRRAVIALAAFSGDDVEAALERARSDRDAQVRQAAEDLLGTTVDTDG